MDASQLYKFRVITGLPEDEIIKAASSIQLDHDTLLSFYMYHGRWPENYEAEFILDAGWEAYLSLANRGIILMR